MGEEKQKGSDTVKMIERAFQILNVLREPNACYGVNELARICSLSPSTTFRIVKTIEKMGWAFQLSDARYIIGPKVSFVTEKDNLYLALRDVAGFIMKKYTDKCGQAMNLMVRDSINCYIIQQSKTNSFINYIPPIGIALPFYACACGKILLSELPIRLVEEILSSSEMVPLTPYTITDKDAFWTELRNIVGQGYAFDHKESSLNGSCIAVPVRDHKGTTIAALSFSGFLSIEDPQILLTCLPDLQEAASEISHALYDCWQF